MNQDNTQDFFEEDGAFDLGLQAAFGANAPRKSGAAAAASVLHVVGQTQKVPHVLLQDVEEDENPLFKALLAGTEDFPTQIDRYHVIGEIARGGVGVILMARDLDLGRDVALKILRNEYRGNSEMTHRFLEEAQIGGQLQHPGILPVHEIGLYEVDRPYLAMKYIRGQTLAERIESRPSLDQDRPHFLGIFEQLCQTMAYAHSKGVIHRDLKPSNIMLGAFGEVQIMDWGLAKVMQKGGVTDDKRSSRPAPDASRISTWRSDDPGSDSLAGTVMGTPAYMPPEQANGDVELINERSDVFGLGAILCEVLTGKPPYTGGSSDAILQKARAAELAEAFGRLDACGADKELIALARSCLQADPHKRPSNAIIVTNRLKFYLESLENRAQALIVKTAKTKFRMILALFAVIGLVLAGVGYVLLDQAQERQKIMADRACLETEKLTAQARAAGGLSMWESALREAKRAIELAVRSGEEETEKRARQLHDDLEANLTDQRILVRLERLKEDRGARADEILRSFHDVFSSMGVDLEAKGLQASIKILRDSRIKDPLVLALDQWRNVLGMRALSRGLFELAQAVDDNAWRRQLRSALVSRNTDDLSRLAEEAKIRELSPSTFELLARAFQPNPWYGHGKRSMESWERAAQLWRRAQAVHPDDFWINVNLGKFLRNRKDYDEAIQYSRIAVALRPQNGYARYELGSVLAARGSIADAFGELRKSVVFDPNAPWGVAYYKALSILRESREEVPEEAIETTVQALQSIKVSGRPFHFDGCIQLLAGCQHAAGKTGEAILILEDANRHRGTSAFSGMPFRNRFSRMEQLKEYRRLLLPDITSCASIDAILDDRLPEGRRTEQLDAFRKHHETEAGGVLPSIRYLDARLLQLDNRMAEAIPLFRQVATNDQTSPEPFFRLAECLYAQGEFEEAEEVLRKALKHLSVHCPDLWNLWITIAFRDLKWSSREALSVFPAAPEPTIDYFASYGQDLLWLLNRLASGKPVLINCGGTDYQAPDDGALWSRDRFFNWASGTYMGQDMFLGQLFFGDIAGTRKDLLYQTERWFPSERWLQPNAGKPGGYCIPLPAGQYEVTLHFAEIFEGANREGKKTRCFDIRAEGRTIREKYEPVKKGFAVADQVISEIAVSDGFLDIELIHRKQRENPKISAIAVKPVD